MINMLQVINLDPAYSSSLIGSKNTYRWSDGRVRHQHVDNMKQIAGSGQGLNSYIITRVKNL